MSNKDYLVWTPNENDRLTACALAGTSVFDTARTLDRTVPNVVNKLATIVQYEDEWQKLCVRFRDLLAAKHVTIEDGK